MDEISRTSIAAKLAEKAAQPAGESVAGTVRKDSEGASDDNVLRHILPGQHLVRVPVDRLVPAPEGQARQDFNEERLQALAESLKRSGVREPIIVTPHGAEPGRFQIVAGERRWRAAQLAGLADIPCIVDPGLIERKDKLLAQAEENLHRENLNPVEEAAVLVQLMEARGVDAKEAGGLLGKSQRQVRRLLQLHGAVAPIKRAVARGQLDARAAVEMVRIHNRWAREDETPSGSKALKRIECLIERYAAEEWSVRRLEQFVARLEGEAQSGPAGGQGNGNAALSAKRGEPHAMPPPAHGEVPSSLVIAKSDGKVIIDIERIERRDVTPEDRAAIIALLEELLFKVRRA